MTRTKFGCWIELKYHLIAGAGYHEGDYRVRLSFVAPRRGFEVNEVPIQDFNPEMVFHSTKYRKHHCHSFSAEHIFFAIFLFWKMDSGYPIDSEFEGWYPSPPLKAFFAEAEVRRMTFDFFILLADEFYPAHGFVAQRLAWVNIQRRAS